MEFEEVGYVYDIERLRQQPNYREGKWWMSPLNFIDAVAEPFSGRSVVLHDVTLRDGEQTVGVAYSADERVAIAEALDEIGVPRIEVGLPPVSAEVREGMRRIAARGLNAKLMGFARTLKSDVDMVVDCGLGAVVLPVAGGVPGASVGRAPVVPPGGERER